MIAGVHARDFFFARLAVPRALRFPLDFAAELTFLVAVFDFAFFLTGDLAAAFARFAGFFLIPEAAWESAAVLAWPPPRNLERILSTAFLMG